MTKIYTFEYNDKIDGYECIDHPMAAGGEFVRLDEYDTMGRQLAAQEDALGSCREAFEGLEAENAGEIAALEAERDGLRAEVERLSNACEDALDWINDFGQHSSIAFGGEAELANKLTKALNLPGEQ